MRASSPGILHLARNSVYAMLTVGATAACLFIVYRMTAASLGLGALGIWSVTFGLMSLTSLADLGLPLAMVREVARMRTLSEGRGIGKLIAAAVLYTFAATLIVALLALPAIEWAVERAILKDSSTLAAGFAFACALATSLTSVAAALTGALEGFERYDLKFISLLVGNVALVGAAHVLLKSGRQESLAWCFVVQTGLSSIAAAIAVTVSVRRIPTPGDLHHAPTLRVSVTRAARIGVPLRVAGLATFFFEPVTRFVIGSFGGPASVGIYEAASRLCIQAHLLISGGLQVLVPRLSALSATGRDRVGTMLGAASRMTAIAAVLGFCAIGLAAYVLSLLLLSSANPDFILLVVTLGGAWMSHVLAAPTYFANIADGAVVWNWLSQWIAVAISVTVGPLCGLLFGWHGVVAGPLLGLLAATITAILARRRRTHESVLSIPLRQTIVLLGLAGFLAAIQVFASVRLGQAILVWVCAATFVIFCTIGAVVALRALRQIAAAESARTILAT